MSSGAIRLLAHSSALVLPVSIIVKSTLLVGVGLVVVKLQKNVSATRRALTLQLTVVGLMLLPLLSVILPALQVPIIMDTTAAGASQAPTTTAGNAKSSPLAAANHTRDTLNPIAGNYNGESGLPTASEGASTFDISAKSLPISAARVAAQKKAQSPSLPVLPILFAIWAIVATAMLCGQAVALNSLRKLLRTCKPSSEKVQAIAHQIAVRELIGRTIRIFIASPHFGNLSPMTWGWKRPTILLSSEAENWDNCKLQAVFEHEIGHIARYDWPMLILGNLITTLYWFQPLAWVLRTNLRNETEQACDDRALLNGALPKAYAAMLLQIAKTSAPSPFIGRGGKATFFLSIAMARSTARNLETRLKSILSSTVSRTPKVSGILIPAALFMVLLVSPLSATRLVSKSRILLGKPGIKAAKSQSTSLDLSGLAEDSNSAGIEADSFVRSNHTDRIGTAAHINGLRMAIGASEELRETTPQAKSAHDAIKENFVDLSGVRWGEAKDGLQAGSRIIKKGRPYAPKERVSFDCFLRNVSDHEIAFEYGAHFSWEQLPTVFRLLENGSRQPIKIIGAMELGLDPSFTAILKPGEAVKFYANLIGLGKEQVEEKIGGKSITGDYPYMVNPTDGEYIVSHSILYLISDKATIGWLIAKSKSKDPSIIEHRIETVIGKDGHTHPQESAMTILAAHSRPLISGENRFTISSSPIIQTVNGESISWGQEQNGLQAGLRSTTVQPVYHYGSTIAMDYVIRNRSAEPVTISYEDHPGVEGYISQIRDEAGKDAYTIGIPVLHTTSRVQVTLQPNKSVTLGKTQMGVLGSNAAQYVVDQPSRASNFVCTHAGLYEMRHMATVSVTHAGGPQASLTLYTGHQLVEIADREEAIAWGPVTQGLCSGLRVHSVGEPQKLGSEIQCDLWVANTSKKKVIFSYFSNRDKFFVPTLHNAGGKSVAADWHNGNVELFMIVTQTLNPGERMVIAHPFFTIASQKRNTAENQLSELTGCSWFASGSGAYTVKMSAELTNVEVGGAAFTDQYRIAKQLKLPSGSVSITVEGSTIKL